MQQNPSNQRPIPRYLRPSRLLGVATALSLMLAGNSLWASNTVDGELLAQAQQPQQQQQERMHQPGERQPMEQPGAEATPEAAEQQMQAGVQQEVRELRQEIHELRTQTAVRGFSDFVDEYQRDDRFKEQAQHYGDRGLRLLNGTIGEFITPEDQQLKQQHQQLTQRIDQLAEMPDEQRQPEMIRELFIESTNLLVNVQQQHYPQFAQQTQQLRQLAEQIEPEPLEGQAERINEFFQTSSLVFERMAQSPTDVIGGGPLEQDDPMFEQDDPMMDHDQHHQETPGYQEDQNDL